MQTENRNLDELSPMEIAQLLQRRAEFYKSHKPNNKRHMERSRAYAAAAALIRREAEK